MKEHRFVHMGCHSNSSPEYKYSLDWSSSTITLDMSWNELINH